MDRRDLAQLFRERLRELIDTRPGGLARFARATGIDRSALSQLLDDRSTRLPRAETLRAAAEATGVTVDWLLGLSNAPAGASTVTPVLAVEAALDDEGYTPIERWRAEARGYKLRYIPSILPHLMWLPDLPMMGAGPRPELGTPARAADARLRNVDSWLADMDIEIAMPLQAIEDIAFGGNVWRGVPARERARQISHAADIVARHYPTLRLHLFDARMSLSSPFTVFGPIRAVIFLGPSYLVVTAADQVQALARHFDRSLRSCSVGPERAADALRAYVGEVG